MGPRSQVRFQFCFAGEPYFDISRQLWGDLKQEVELSLVFIESPCIEHNYLLFHADRLRPDGRDFYTVRDYNDLSIQIPDSTGPGVTQDAAC